MILKTKGIVINETNYGETSKILNVLTEDYGNIGVIAKGSRTMKSHLRGVSQKLIYGEFTINYKEKGLSNLNEVSLINTFRNIFIDFKKAGYAFYLVDLIKQVLKDNNDKEIFSLLESSLIKINDGLLPLFITNIVELQLLKFLGVSLGLNECIVCGNKQNIKTISSNLGGMICDNCYHEGYVFNQKTVKLLRLMSCVSLDKLDSVTINEDVIKEIDDFIKEYYSLYTGIYLKNKDNLKRFI